MIWRAVGRNNARFMTGHSRTASPQSITTESENAKDRGRKRRTRADDLLWSALPRKLTSHCIAAKWRDGPAGTHALQKVIGRIEPGFEFFSCRFGPRADHRQSTRSSATILVTLRYKKRLTLRHIVPRQGGPNPRASPIALVNALASLRLSTGDGEADRRWIETSHAVELNRRGPSQRPTESKLTNL